eukprot:scaffold50250_cov34-Prasinocladus_malaysianus.AAC.1
MTQPWHTRQENNAWPVCALAGWYSSGRQLDSRDSDVIIYVILSLASTSTTRLKLSKLGHLSTYSSEACSRGCLYRRICRSWVPPDALTTTVSSAIGIHLHGLNY